MLLISLIELLPTAISSGNPAQALMAFAAGAMVFVSLHKLVPMARRYGFIPMFILGIIASIAIHSMLRVFLPE